MKIPPLVLSAIVFSACAGPAPAGRTAAEARLDSARAGQLSAAAAAVQAAKFANESSPPGNPKAAVAGELGVADANLPPPAQVDARVAQARVEAALAGRLGEAGVAWNAAEQRAEMLAGKISLLEQQVAAERAAALAEHRHANERLCVLAALGAGGLLFVFAALSLAAGMYFGLRKLEYGAAGLGLCSVLAFFAATQVGSARFDWLAMLALAGGVAGLVFTVWMGFCGGSRLKARAGGYDCAMLAIKKYAGENPRRKRDGASRLLLHLAAELDRCHKNLVPDWGQWTTPARRAGPVD